jgi:hypothetical protein
MYLVFSNMFVFMMMAGLMVVAAHDNDPSVSTDMMIFWFHFCRSQLISYRYREQDLYMAASTLLTHSPLLLFVLCRTDYVVLSKELLDVLLSALSKVRQRRT